MGSPIGNEFRVRLRNFPSLVNCCTIDWFMEWPPQALTAVAHQFLRNIEIANEIKMDCEKDLALAMPALEAAVDALSKLSKGDIGEMMMKVMLQLKPKLQKKNIVRLQNKLLVYYLLILMYLL